MDKNRTTAITVGVFMLMATVSFMIGSGLIESVLNHPEYLNHVYPNRTKLVLGIFLVFMDAAFVFGIGMLMFPVLKKHNEAIALGYFGTRVMESVTLIVSIISLLILIPLSQEYTAAGTTGGSYQTIGTLAIKGYDTAFQLAMLVLGLGSLMFCCLLYTSKLIPRLISVIGFIGYVALIASSCLEIFGFEVSMILYLPGALFEIIFPIWLIIKGFHSPQKILIQ
ncbi:DUF4386 domain-containing protein [Paenibacillus wynnii]|uniref:DUF4386 domain-containing protein n=1 Tax=Paenibacillus wynnii TaxID=268407 RepID=A0A098M4F0_9BACL|nr:DUF4386 domain-containing protein [Paenibacillus wynnii]KGE17429.1 hypothetical protein PWYN_22770 [Paenibacillus wynnii]